MTPSRLDFKRNELTKIPRPLNSFMIFRLEKQREIVKQCPGANHRDMSKIISKWWRELIPEKKQVYIEQAERYRLEHRRLYPNYKFTPKKRTSAARPYKKRPDTELIARDFDDKQQLLSLYHHGKDIGPSEKNSLINYIENTKKTPAKKTITKIKKRNTDSDIINFNCSPSSSNSDPYQISSMEDNSLFYNSQLLCPTDAASSLSSLSLLSHHSVYSPSMASVSSNNGSHSSLLQDFIDPASSYLVNCAAAFFTTTTTTTTDCFMNQAFSLFSTASDPIFDNGTRMMIGPFSTHGHNMLPVYHQQQEDAYSSPPAPAQLLTQPFFYNQQQ